MSVDNLIEFILGHRGVAVALAAIWAFVSLCLIARLWVIHRRDLVIAKLSWTVVLLVPLLGWLFFAAFYRSPEALGWTGHAEHGRDAYVESGVGPGH